MIPSSIAKRYKAVQVKTCSPGEIVVLLYQGVLRFLGEAAVAMRAGDRARAGDRIDRAHAILSELATTLRREAAPELCDELQGIYFFCMGHIVEANLHQDPTRLDAAAHVLTPLSEAFTQAVRATEPHETAEAPAASLSLAVGA